MRPLVRVACLATLVVGSTALAGDLELQSADGISLRATSWGSGETGVVLVHEAGRTRVDWGPFGAKLAERGLFVVAVDLRGHGESGGTAGEEDFPLMVADVAAAAAWLTEQGARQVTVVGAGLGANLALNVAADQEEVGSVVLVAPRPNIKGVKVLRAIEAYQGSLLILAAADDNLESRTATALEERALGPNHVEMVVSGEGHHLVTRDADAETLVTSWLLGTFDVGGSDGLSGRKQVTTGDLSEIETTGVKYGETKQ